MACGRLGRAIHPGGAATTWAGRPVAEHMRPSSTSCWTSRPSSPAGSRSCRRPEERAAILEECEQLYARLAAREGHRPGRWSAAASCRPCSPTARAIIEVVDNLLSNAIKFTYPGGAVRVWLRAGGAARSSSTSRTPARGLRRATCGTSSSASASSRARPTGGESRPASAWPSSRRSSRRTAAPSGCGAARGRGPSSPCPCRGRRKNAATARPAARSAENNRKTPLECGDEARAGSLPRVMSGAPNHRSGTAVERFAPE